ncbi:MAG TPA: tetratricopeptide repeat protein, partial [Acidobacteriaceae bacterium]
DEVVQNCREAVKKNPTDPEAWLNLGDACRQRGQFALAADTYRQAVLLSPNDARGLVNLAETLRDLGHASEANETYDHALTVIRSRMRPHDRGLTTDQIDVHALTRALADGILQS